MSLKENSTTGGLCSDTHDIVLKGSNYKVHNEWPKPYKGERAEDTLLWGPPMCYSAKIPNLGLHYALLYFKKSTVIPEKSLYI